jgi:hypothetical protein
MDPDIRIEDRLTLKVAVGKYKIRLYGLVFN